MDHRSYDKRNYPIVEVREGYAGWAATYEQTVLDEMDIRLLERLRSVDWSRPRAILDLACGTGRTARWLKERSRAAIDGIDLTPEMVEVARGRDLYRELRIGEVTRTGLPDGAYELCVQSLADEHLPRLGPLYREVARVTAAPGVFVIVGFHPQFLMAGMPTHYDRAPGDPVTIRSHVHLISDHVRAAGAAGWALVEMEEGLVNEAWLAQKPKWKRHAGTPVSFAMVWKRAAAGRGPGGTTRRSGRRGR